MAMPSLSSGVIDCARTPVVAAIDRPAPMSVDLSIDMSRSCVAGLATILVNGRRKRSAADRTCSCRLPMDLMPSFYAGSVQRCKNMRYNAHRPQRSTAPNPEPGDDYPHDPAGALRAVPRHGRVRERAAPHLYRGLTEARCC